MKRNVLLISLLLMVCPATQAAEPLASEPELHQHEHQHGDEHQHEHHDDDDFTALGTHTHGQGVLTLVLEGNEMQLAFQAAAYSVLGFEHKPSTAEQQQEVAAAIAVFNQGDWFSVNPQASCEQVAADASTDLTQAGHTGGHADFYANYQLLCQSPARLESLTLSIFTLLPGLDNISVQWIINGQQGAASASMAQNTVQF